MQQYCYNPVMSAPNQRPIGSFGNTLRYYRRRKRISQDKLTDAFWLGHQGALGLSGLRDALNRRVAKTGLPKIHLHMFRHTFAHKWLSDGGQEGDLMRLAGWRSRTMLLKYGSSAADERAREAHKRLSPGDKI